MAAEIVGTAYVRIRAITAGLAKDISDGVDKGVKDADVDKAGKKLGGDLGESSTKQFSGSMADGIGESLDAPDVHKAAEKGGEGVGKDVSKGIDKEHKKNNPFAALGDRLKAIDLSSSLKPQLKKMGSDFDGAFDDFDLDFDIPGMERDAEKAGEKTGDAHSRGIEKSHKKNNPFEKFGKSLSGLAPPPINWLAIFGPTTLAPIIGSIVAGIGLITQALGFVVLAAAGAGVALAGIAAVAAPGLGMLFAAFKTETEQLKQFKEGAKKLLAPWRQLGIQTQKHLLPGITKFLESIAELIPLFTEGKDGADSFATTIGKTFGGMAEWVGLILKGTRAQEALGLILGESEEFFRDIAAVALTFIDMLLPFLAAAAPLATQFSESLKGWAAGLHESFVEMEGEELTEKFQGWYNKLALLVGIVGDVFVGLWNILSIAGETGTPFFDKIAEAADKFREFTSSAEGKNKITAFFANIQPVLDQVWRLLGNVWDLIVQPATGDGGALVLERLAGALDILNDVLEDPLTAKIVPLILGIATGLTLLSLAGKGVGVLNTVGGNIKTLAEGLWKLTWPLRIVIELIGKLAWAITKILVQALWELSVFLVTNPVGWVLLAIAAAALVVYLSFKNWDKIVEIVKGVWEWFTNLALPFKIIVGYLAAFILLTNPWLLFIGALIGLGGVIKNWDKVVEVIGELKDKMVEFFENLPELLLEFAAAVVEFAKTVPEKLGAIWEAIKTFLEPIPGRIKEALLTGLQAIPGLILDGLGELGNLGLTIIGWIGDGLIAAAPVLGEWFIRLPIMIWDWLFTAAADILELGGRLLMWILDGLAGALPELATWVLKLPWEIATLIRRGLWQLIKLGTEMMISLLTGIFEERSRIFDFFHDLPLNILRAIAATAEFLFNFGKGLIRGMWRGIVAMWPQVRSFFAELPGKILRLLSGVGGFLVHIGAKLMNGLWEGINEVWDSIDEFFGELPGKIGGFFKRLPGMVVGALSEFVSTVIGFFADLVDQLVGHSIIPDLIWDIVEWFAKLPLEIVGALFDLVTTVVGVFWDLGVQLVAALPGAFQTVWDWFTGLPLAIFDLVMLGIQTILDLGGKIVSSILEGITTGVQTLWDWFTALPEALLGLLDTGIDKVKEIGGKIIGWIKEGLEEAWGKITEWVSTFPEKFKLAYEFYTDKIKDIGGAIIGWIKDGLEAAWEKITTWVSEFPEKLKLAYEFYKDKITDIGGSIIGFVVDGLKKAFEVGGAIYDWIKDFPENLLAGLKLLSDKFGDIGADMIGWVIDGIGDLAGALFDLLKGAWNEAVDMLPEFKGPFGIHVSADFLKIDLAEGGVFPGRPGGYSATIGEAGAEAVIPLTKPARALQLMQQAGLDKMVLNSYAGGTGTSTVGDTTMLHIDTAIMQTPVDVDMVAQRVTAAYNRIAS